MVSKKRNKTTPDQRRIKVLEGRLKTLRSRNKLVNRLAGTDPMTSQSIRSSTSFTEELFKEWEALEKKRKATIAKAGGK